MWDNAALADSLVLWHCDLQLLLAYGAHGADKTPLGRLKSDAVCEEVLSVRMHHVYTWRPEVDTKCLPLLLYFILRQGLSLNLGFTDWLA